MINSGHLLCRCNNQQHIRSGIMYEADELDIRSKSNVRENGEVFTPSKIVKDMMSEIPKESWNDSEYCFLEPSCGNGQFLVKIFEHRIDCGMSIEVALNTMVGMDITYDNISECHFRLYERACSQMRVEGMTPQSKKWYDRAAVIIAIVRNNVFRIEDSIEYINSGKLNSRKFFFEDPTSNNQVLTKKVRKRKLDGIKKSIKRYKKASTMPKESTAPFFKRGR